jgi:hypothetical protein
MHKLLKNLQSYIMSNVGVVLTLIVLIQVFFNDGPPTGA